MTIVKDREKASRSNNIDRVPNFRRANFEGIRRYLHELIGNRWSGKGM